MNGLDKDNTYVLLIGASTYPNWQVMDIPNVHVNLKEFEALLSDPFYCGISSEKITVIEDENLENTNNTIQEFFDNIQTPKATVLLYYSGHGLQSVKAMDDLFLATRNIREKTFEASSIKISELRRQFSECIASRKILLLDCCYAGKISRGFMGADTADSLAKLNDFEGTYIMAASSEYERARFDAEDPNVPTKFTGKFIDVIKNGIDSDDEYCTLNSIYNQIRSSFHDQKDAPRPVQIGRDNIGNFPIFRNKKFTERVPKDEQLWNKIINSNSINAYNTFIDQFPESQYTREAVKKIKDIEDEAAWRKACNKNTIGGYWEYVNNYDNHKEDAKKRLKDLSAIEQENEIWQNAITENKVKLFEEYRNNYPNGRHIDEAKTIIEKLTRSEKEESDWNAVDKENILSLNEYLTKFPAGKYYEEATLRIELLRKKDEERKKLEEEANLKKLEEERKRENEERMRLKQTEEEEQHMLTEQKLWEQLNSINTVKSFNKYLKNYPEGKFVVDAREKIELLKKTSEGEPKRPDFLTSFVVDNWEIITVLAIAIIVVIVVFKVLREPPVPPNPIADSTNTIADTTVANSNSTDTGLNPDPSKEQSAPATLSDTIKGSSSIAKETSAQSTDSQDYVYYYNRGIDKDRLSNYAGAIADYTKAIALNPNDASIYQNRGAAKFNLKNYNGAINDYSKAIQLNPNDSDIYFNRGSAYYMLDNNDKAIKDFSEAIKLDANYANAYAYRGDCYRFLNDLDKACVDYKKAQDLGNVFGTNNFSKYCSTISIDKIDVEISHNFVRKDGKKGMNIYAKFHILNAAGQKGQINAYFYLGDHKTQLKDNDKDFCDEDGYVSTWEDITPKYQDTYYNIPNNNFPLFIPNSEMDVDAEVGKKYALSFYIVVHINRKTIITSNWYDFNLSF